MSVPYTDAQVADLTARLLDHSLPKAQWTHAAHLSATLRLVRTRNAGLERDMPRIIQTYNVAVGGVNDDHKGYHETITQAYLAAIRAFVATLPTGTSDSEASARLLATPMGDKAWPLSFWSRGRLFSVEARRGWVEPTWRRSGPFQKLNPRPPNSRSSFALTKHPSRGCSYFVQRVPYRINL